MNFQAANLKAANLKGPGDDPSSYDAGSHLGRGVDSYTSRGFGGGDAGTGASAAHTLSKLYGNRAGVAGAANVASVSPISISQQNAAERSGRWELLKTVLSVLC